VVLGGNSLMPWRPWVLAAPERVSGLVLTGSSGLFERSFTRGVPHRPSGAFVRGKMEEVFHDPTLVTEEWVESVRRLVTTPASALRVLRFARAARRDNVEACLAELRTPTLLVWGREDRITPPEVAERFCRLIPEAELLYISACGHAPMLEWPDRFAAAVA
jgi:pimeloyl-ACP methyl ester carboxylesterase